MKSEFEMTDQNCNKILSILAGGFSFFSLPNVCIVESNVRTCKVSFSSVAK